MILLLLGPKGVGKSTLVRSLQLIYGTDPNQRSTFESTIASITSLKVDATRFIIIDALRETTDPESLALYQGYIKIADFIICLFDISEEAPKANYLQMKQLFHYFVERDKYVCLIGNKADRSEYKMKKCFYDGHYAITATDPVTVKLAIDNLFSKNQIETILNKTRTSKKTAKRKDDEDYPDPGAASSICCPWFYFF